MKSQSNYEVFEEQARTLFLRYDLGELARKWNLKEDDTYVRIQYFSEEYRIRKSDGKVLAPDPGRTAKYQSMAALTIYDVLTYSSQPPALTGRWESLSSLGGVIGAGHERSLTGPTSGNVSFPPVSQMKETLRKWNGTFLSRTSADVDAVVDVFPFLPMRFQYWEADDEFPASVKYLWDANALLFMHYETLWYAMGDFDRLLLQSGRGQEQALNNRKF